MKNEENTIIIDGRQLEIQPNDTILDVARRNNIFIPTLCHLQGAHPTGACRMCIVEVKGARNFAPACAMPAAKGMVVQTHSPAIVRARRNILGLLLSSGNHNCAVRSRQSGDWSGFQRDVEEYDRSDELCEVYGSCKLQALAYKYQADSTIFAGRETTYPLEDASPLILRDFSRCILCGRCVQACNDIQVNQAISHGFRGARAKIVAMGDNVLERSDCVFCGECIQACPVGALVEKKSRYQVRPWEAQHVRTTCPYCGVGCQLDLHIKNGRVAKVTGMEGAQPNDGRLCVKGRFGFDFLNSSRRLTRPRIRENDQLRDATWEEALDLVAQKIREVRERQGADGIAGVASGKSTNESLYLFQKLFRAAIGTNNVASPFAGTGMTNSLRELEDAPRVLLIGSDITEENPVAGTFLKRGVRKGHQLLVVDSRPTKISSFATLCLKPYDGTEAVLANGLTREIMERKPREGSEELRPLVDQFTLEKVAETTGVPVESLRAAVDFLDVDEPVMLVFGPKVSAWTSAFRNLQQCLGNLSRERGGVNCLTGLNNSHGACDVGVHPQLLPGYRRVEEAADRRVFEEAWDCTLSETPGLSLADMVGAMTAQGEKTGIEFLYCAGENLALGEPATPGIRTALTDVKFLVYQGWLEDETSAQADVILPAAAWVEEDGTYTSCERRVSRVRKAVDPPGEARTETWIYSELARRLGQEWPERMSREIWEQEIAALVPQLRGVSYEGIARDGLQWPATETATEGTAVLDGDSPPPCPTAWGPFNFHHRTLLEQCDGLLEALPREGSVGKRTFASDPREVTAKFEEFLREEELTEKKAALDQILAEYRPRPGGLIPVLQKAQELLGYLPTRVQDYIALGLGVPAADVFGVVSFYSFFTMTPRGKHVIRVCLGTACFVKGSAKIQEKLTAHLKVDVGGTTEDREFSLEAVRCVGACGLAPVVVVDDVTHGQVNPAEIVDIVESYRSMVHEA